MFLGNQSNEDCLYLDFPWIYHLFHDGRPHPIRCLPDSWHVVRFDIKRSRLQTYTDDVLIHTGVLPFILYSFSTSIQTVSKYNVNSHSIASNTQRLQITRYESRTKQLNYTRIRDIVIWIWRCRQKTDFVSWYFTTQ